ncbi:hypothetical protein [Mucilaginibacter sp. BT774]|uniref:OB-fold protein n=1 Tax=Mucilaginibacter sp. BT774 TaxID=3062276 RepID=UPI0026766F1B|nr:hypothetical protein [Mucilaginibacter sp. BT774]MDO3627005.1 hypothetical protein [Mucilaginibacter sp. BT774]
MKNKIVWALIIVVVLGVVNIWYYVFQYSKTHHRDVANEVATLVTSAQLVKDFQSDEKAANVKYLNKAIEVKGELLQENKDQSGNITLTLKSGDPFSNIFCTLQPGLPLPVKGSVIVVKGVCTGFLSDVVLNNAIVVKSVE